MLHTTTVFWIIILLLFMGFLNSQSQNLKSIEIERQIIKSYLDDQMILIEAGMLSLSNKAEHVNSFKISKYEITNWLFKEFVCFIVQSDSQKIDLKFWNSYFEKEADNHPVRYVTYNETRIFINWINNLTGETYRLPTKAEWEFVASGRRNHIYGTLDGEINSALANYANIDGIMIVGSFQPNSLKIYDLAGNVWEWINYSKKIKFSFLNSDTMYALKGGSFLCGADDCKVTNTHFLRPDTRACSCGFRLAK